MSALDWRTSLSADERSLITDLVAAATATDGVAPVGDQVLRELAHDRTRHLVATDGRAVTGYLNLAPASEDAPAMAEAVVAPAARRRGIGAELISTGLAAGGDGARIWAHGDLAAAKATAAALGLTAVRELWQMRRGLADLPAANSSPGLTVRTYKGPADDSELLRVNNAAFSWHPEQGGWTAADIDERCREAWFDPAGLFMAFDDQTDQLLGFHWTKIHSLASGEEGHGSKLGEVYIVGVDPAAQGRGLGALLTLVGLNHLAGVLGDDGIVMLYVEADNSAAVNTYQRLGFEVFSTDVAYASP